MARNRRTASLAARAMISSMVEAVSTGSKAISGAIRFLAARAMIVLNGGADADWLFGEDGQRHIVWRRRHRSSSMVVEGDDQLRGGIGNDALFGGPGNDTYILNLGE